VILYLPLPVILWGSVHFGAKGAAAAIFVLALASIWLTLNDVNPFLDEAPEISAVALQLFLIGIAVPVILLSAAIDQLRQSERWTRTMAGLILTAQDHERRRIARDLHDSTGQNLIAVNLMLSALKENLAEPIARTIQKCSDLLLQSIRELRTHAYVLHPPTLDEEGLPLALLSYVEGLTERTGIEVDLRIAPDIGRFPSEVELLAYRIVQEALSNIQRHSGSATARIELVRRQANFRELVVLTIEDHGRGIDLLKDKRFRSRGVGLESMRERVQQLGGRFTIDSRPGRTVLTAIVPLEVQ
jgi:signal transduction histidine kinase